MIKKPNKVQKSLDSYHIASQSVRSVNNDADVDLEMVINNEGTKWVDVETEPSELSPNIERGVL